MKNLYPYGGLVQLKFNRPFFLFIFLFICFFSELSLADCSASCSGTGAIEVDVSQRCMCVKGYKCFKIDIGREKLGGPMMSANGTGIMGNAGTPGKSKYWTHENTTERYDNDAISFGYDAQTLVGKWIHKSRGCGPGGRDNTIGCVGVPCEHWKEVKEHKGERVVLCGGNRIMTSINGTAGAPRAVKVKPRRNRQ